MIKGEFFSFLAALCWAVAALLYKRIANKYPAFTVNIVRTTGGVTFLAVYILFSGSQITSSMLANLPTVVWLYLFLSSLLAFLVGDTLYIMAIHKIGVSRAMPLASLYPIIVMAFSSYVFMEKITLLMISATTLIVLGIYLLSKPTREEKNDAVFDKRGHWVGVVFAVTANFMWTASIIMLKITTNYLPPVGLTFIRLLILTTVMWIIYFVWYKSRYELPHHPLVWLEATIAGILGTAVGTIFFTLSLSMIPASIATPISSSSPFIGTILAITFLKERSTIPIWLGVSLTTIGIIMFLVY